MRIIIRVVTSKESKRKNKQTKQDIWTYWKQLPFSLYREEMKKEKQWEAGADPGFWNGGEFSPPQSEKSEKSNITSIFEEKKKKERKKGAQKKGDENSPISPPLVPRLRRTSVSGLSRPTGGTEVISNFKKRVNSPITSLLLKGTQRTRI